eukprot:77290_1
MMADTNNKQLNMFMALTSSLLSTETSKRRKRINLSQKITVTILNNPKFSSYLNMSSNLTIDQQLNSIQCQISQRCIQLLQHREIEIHIFAKSLFYKLTDHNDILTNLVLVLIFNSYSNLMPKSLIVLTNNNNQQEIDEELSIVGQLRGMTVMIDRIYDLFKRKNSLKTLYSSQMLSLETGFNFLIYSLCTKPSLLQSQSQPPNASVFASEPYKLPSLALQIILIELWSKYPLLIPNDIHFRTLYLLRWLCRIPSDFESKPTKNGTNIMNLLLNIITINFNTLAVDLNSDKSETVLTLYSLLGFLGGSSIALCDAKSNKTSVLTYRLMERIPAALQDNLCSNINSIISSLGLDQFATIVCAMFEWPQNDRIYKWIADILHNVEQNGYFNLLTNMTVIAIDSISVQWTQLNAHNNLNGALMLSQYLLYGVQRTPQAFHNTVPHLVEAIKLLSVASSGSGDTLFYNVLHELVELSYILLFRWPGYPATYYNLCQILYEKHFTEPKEQRIRYILRKYEWKATRGTANIKDSNAPIASSKSSSSSSYAKSSYYLTYSRANRFRCTITDKAGLTNLGATCYMNSIIQSLYLSDLFRSELVSSYASLTYKMKHNSADNDHEFTMCIAENKWQTMKQITVEVQSILRDLLCTKRQAVSTKKLVDILPMPWTAGRQHDASEFAKYLLDCVWCTILHSDACRITSTIDPFFGGLQRNNIKCNDCGNISSKLEPFTEIALSMEGDDVDAMMKHHFACELLEGDNKYFCDKCNGKVCAQRYTEIVEAPQHLIICFKRFSWNYTTMKRCKKSDVVDCPLQLRLDVCCQEEEEEMKQIEHKTVQYVLYSVVIHSGKSAEYGHYYTIGRPSTTAACESQNSKWFMFNDRSVSISDYDKLCKVSTYYKNDVPYLLFYRRVHGNDAIANDNHNADDSEL